MRTVVVTSLILLLTTACASMHEESNSLFSGNVSGLSKLYAPSKQEREEDKWWDNYYGRKDAEAEKPWNSFYGK